MKTKKLTALDAQEHKISLRQFMISTEKQHFILNKEQWQTFSNILNRSGQDKHALKRLLQKKSVFECLYSPILFTPPPLHLFLLMKDLRKAIQY
ncbi:MAG: hypothetical protein WAQ53_06375 [Thiofilum sp.]|uniref:hypothetical protein n=1 Tax=Thiofilum sp. TaxID=2212733 RepID=UPI0025CCCCCC|nr:hypothetical protein [Thiofilum sp.]MBK8454960.1 hypothetical protein [Thiofilum sp.]